jgi:hypothetical protein
MKTIAVLAIVLSLGVVISDAASAQGMKRRANETPAQCTKRLFPKGYSVKNFNQCMKSCADCYTTSGGSGCSSYCQSQAR